MILLQNRGVDSGLQRWLVIAGLGPLLAASNAFAQPIPSLHYQPAPSHKPTIDLRLVEEPGLTQIDPPNRGFLADTELGANVRMGIRLMTVSRPRLGPEWRVDGRALRSRKPAISFSYRF